MKTRVPLKSFAPALIVVFNSLVWFTLTTMVFGDLIDNLSLQLTGRLALHGVHFAAIALSALAGTLFSGRRRDLLLFLWMVSGTFATLLFPFFHSSDFATTFAFSVLLGMTIGLGLPSSLSCFADATGVENRGTYGGIVWSTVGLGILGMAVAVSTLDTFQTFFVLAAWRGIGSLLYLGLSRHRGSVELPVSSASFGAILSRRDLMLYLLPWIMFSMVNFSEQPILGKLFGDSQAFIGFIEVAISGIFAVVGGILADIVGRKRVVIMGFVILGIEYAVLSLFSAMKVSWYVYTVLDGIAWGMFASVFFMTVWGDLAENARKEKYYLLGGLPYLLVGLLPYLVKPFVEEIGTVTAFSLASFFLFVAVLPLMYAPETLPEKRIREREVRDYVERAKQTKQKYA